MAHDTVFVSGEPGELGSQSLHLRVLVHMFSMVGFLIVRTFPFYIL